VEKDAPALPSGKEALEEILDSQLSAVTFVMDYVQFEFHGPRLTAVTWPTVLVGDRLFRLGDPGYRDELCARIAKKVTSIEVRPHAIVIAFDDAALVAISLRAEDLLGRGAESAIFDGKCLVAFRPGE